MFDNYLAAALRHLARNRLYSAISIFGLAVGLCAALMAALVIDSELRYDHFLPGYEHTYLAVSVGTPPGHAPLYYRDSNSRLAALLQLYSNARVTRLWPEKVQLRHDAIESKEAIYWADPNVFEVLPLPRFAGDLAHALQRPDSLVLTRSMARKYFGRDDARGQTLLLAGTHPMTVTAVLEDLPPSQLESGIFASGVAANSALAQNKVPGVDSVAFQVTVRTYLRVFDDRSLEALRNTLAEIVRRMWPLRPPDVGLTMEFARFDAVHAFPAFNPGLNSRLALTGIVGALILFVACVNFVNLLTARSVNRAKEVAVRKVAGASRRALVAQFIGESFVYVAIATLLGLALAEWGLPYVNAFLHSSARADWWRDPTLVAWAAMVAVILGVLVGAYPALVLSAFRPAGVLNGSRRYLPGAHVVRQSLVTLQFAVLIGLMIVAGVVWEQRRFATTAALRVDTDQMLVIRSPCNTVFVTELRSLPGVRGAGCSGDQLLGDVESLMSVGRPHAGLHSIDMVPVQKGTLELYGVKPLAGSLSELAGSGAGDLTRWSSPTARFAINETAARALGFATAGVAIGQSVRAQTFGGGPEDNRIVAVVPDFSLASVEKPVVASAYFESGPLPPGMSVVNAKLGGHQLPETLAGIDRLWLVTGGRGPIDRFFMNDHIQSLYISLLREAQAFAVFCAVALLLACLGLLGLSASVAERRTREIGIRKATGAGTLDIVRLLLFQFGKPVVWANLIAWPIAGYAMSRWLRTFAYHVHLQPALFAAAASVALIIALLTVSTHSILVARSRTAAALRYE
jgi:putative ABC transport system permease protein